MLTPDDVLNTFRGLECLGLRRPEAIDTEGKLRSTARVWCEVLGAKLDAAGLSAAVRAHLADPVRGRFWPVPADLLAASGTQEPAALPDPDEAAWAMLQTVPRGESVRGRLGPEQFRALESIGGMWAVTTAEGDVARATLRRRFIDAARAFRTQQAPQLVAIEGGACDLRRIGGRS